MQIPKFILHPSLLILAGLVMGALVWVSPSAVDPASAPSGYVRIDGIDDKGQMKLSDRTATVTLIFTDSDKASPQSWANLNSHFRGLFIKTPVEQTDKIVFPLELYDATCFAEKVPEELSCPVVVTP